MGNVESDKTGCEPMVIGGTAEYKTVGDYKYNRESLGIKKDNGESCV